MTYRESRRRRPSDPGDGVFRVTGLPQHGFSLRRRDGERAPRRVASRASLRVLRVDPRAVVPAASPGTTVDTPTVVSFFGAPREGWSVWLADGVFATSAVAPPGGTRIAGGLRLTGEPQVARDSRSAVGVEDEDGFLDWVELSPNVRADASTAATMDALLGRMGCTVRLLVGADARAVLGRGQDLDGASVALPATPSTRLVRGHPSSARAYFESTPLVPQAVWQPLQAQRVRYFPKPSRAPPAGSASPTGSSAAPAATPATAPPTAPPTARP
jgi:hypothetical protein